MTAGGWSSPTMPARYTRGIWQTRGAVARYYGSKRHQGVLGSPGLNLFQLQVVDNRRA